MVTTTTTATTATTATATATATATTTNTSTTLCAVIQLVLLCVRVEEMVVRNCAFYTLGCGVG